MATRGMNENRNTKGMKISYKEKAQNGKKVVKKTTVTKKVDPTEAYRGMKDAFGNSVGGPGNVPPFTVKKTTVKKKAKSGGKMGKCKGGC